MHLATFALPYTTQNIDHCQQAPNTAEKVEECHNSLIGSDPSVYAAVFWGKELQSCGSHTPKVFSNNMVVLSVHNGRLDPDTLPLRSNRQAHLLRLPSLLSGESC